MKWSFASVGLIAFGLIGVTIIMLFEELTTTNENDYYLLKEVTEAAMVDAIDISYYRETGELRIVREKFVENFTRRFAESTLLTGSGYTISFFDIIETPPKVSVAINTGIGEYTIYEDTSSYSVSNNLDAILEYIGKETYPSSSSSSSIGSLNNPYEIKEYTKNYYSMPGKTKGSTNIGAVAAIKVPDELNAPNIKNIKIKEVKILEDFNLNREELNIALLNREIDYCVEDEPTNYYSNFLDKMTKVQAVQINYCNYDDYTSTCDNNKITSDYPYWIIWNGIAENKDKEVGIIKYEVTWLYEEYEY